MNKCALIGGILLSSLMATNAFATNHTITCPTLTPADIKTIIYDGRIHTDGWDLMDETGLSPDEIRADEPTADPFDEYYVMLKFIYFNNIPYLIGVGNVLGSSTEEARERAEKIVLTSEEDFTGKVYDDHTCMYKLISASQEIPSYPFKTTYETVSVMALARHHSPGDDDNFPKNMHK